GEPQRGNAQRVSHRRQNRHNDKSDFHEVDKEAKNQNGHHRQNQETGGTTGQIGQNFFHNVVAAGVAERHRERRRTQQNGKHHGGNLNGFKGRIHHHFPAELSVQQRQQQCSHTAQRGGFRRCGNARKNRPQ